MPLTLTHRRRAAAVAIALATVIVAPIVAPRRFDPVPDGLRAQYFPNPDWSGDAARSEIGSAPSTAHVLRDIGDALPRTFSGAWNGWLIAPGSGAYTFATSSRDGSWVYVNRELVVDNGGGRAARAKSGPTIVLERGLHAVFVKNVQTGGDTELTFLWQRGAGPFEPVPSWAMRPRRIAYGRFVLDRMLDVAGTAAARGWLAALLCGAAFAFWPGIASVKSRVSASRRQLMRDGAWPALAWIVAGSAALNIVGLWWGLPHGVWVGDELVPVNLVRAWAQRFSHGWYDKYPPLHYYALTLAYLPVIGVEQLVGLQPRLVETLLMLAGRAVSVVMGAATVAATYLAGRRAFGARAGLFAAAMLALVAPFIYYAKAANVDVPYLCWFAISLIFYLRVLEGAPASDYAWWAVTGTLAVCTKDQAYGLYLLMPVAAIYEMWRGNARAGLSRPFWRAATDRRLGIAAVAAAAVFVVSHNLIFNASGFAGHFRTIVGPITEGYRGFEPTFQGRLALLDLTVRLVAQSWGGPMFIVAIAGTVLALVTPERRRVAIWLLLPVVSYYVGFINVVLYNYDRFMMPVVLILALFGGYALDRLTSPAAPFRMWRMIAVSAVFLYTLLYSATVDALMLRDSRYAVERWLAARAGPDDLVATSSFTTYMPRTTGINSADVYDSEALATLRPRFFVVNADYTLTEPADSPLGQILSRLRSGTGGYRLVFTTRAPSPWPWLPGGHKDLVGPRRDPEMVSFLRNINPTIEIFERVPGQ